MECRPWAYNWWPGSAVDKENLARELRRYQQGGLGGIHIIPIYGAKGAEDRYIDFLSPRWMEMLRFTLQEGKKRNLGVDMSMCSGWCFGGPNIPPELGCRQKVAECFPFPPDGRLPDKLRPPQVTVQALVAKSSEGRKQEITDRLKKDGTINWTPPQGSWSLYLLGHRFTGRMVKRAGPGGAGPMMNPISPAAMRKYLKRFNTAFAASDVKKPRSMYHDSFEYDNNWSPELPAQFAQRRGYRVEDELPALMGQGGGDLVTRVRCDVSETTSDIMVEDVFPQWVEWCHKRGMKTRFQAHGAQGNWLDLYALADIPETEMFGRGGPDPLESRFDENISKGARDPLISKFASSAAHAAGLRFVSAETGTWLAEHFCETFEELKCEIDLLLLSGINHIFYHGCVYSPDDAKWPGWLFYASTQMNPRNPLWREVSALNDYVTRCQSVLQSGQPDNDVLLYWPIHDSWSRGVENMSVENQAALTGPLGKTARRLWARGYGFDYVSDRLLAAMKTERGNIIGPDGTTWQAVVVPICRQMPHTTFTKLLDLSEAGATVIFEGELPQDVPGLGRLELRRASLCQQKERLTLPRSESSGDPLKSSLGKGLVYIGALDKALTSAGIRRETLVDEPGLKFVRRRQAEGRHCFLVNHGLKAFEGWIKLATLTKSAVIMDPLTGKTGVARIRQTPDDKREVYVRLEPGHSIILRTFTQKRIEGPCWKWLNPGEVVTQIDGPWQVEFIEGGPVLPKQLKMHQLRSWSLFGPDAEAFAGTARYHARFNLPSKSANDAKMTFVLDLGEVKHICRIYINGKLLGALIMHPYRLAIPSGLLRSNDNVLEVEVTNLAANRIRYLDQQKVNWKIFHNINIVNIKYEPFDAINWPVFDSGMLGPVCIRSGE